MNTPLPVLALLSLAAVLGNLQSQAGQGEFSSTTIDVGVVVSDIDAAAKFYTETLGFSEVGGFSVGAEFCRDAGLTDAKPLTIRVFALGEGDKATKLKLMEVEGAEAKESDNTFVHSQLGLSYLTIYVTDMTQALKRLELAGLKPLAKCPVSIGEGDAAPELTLVRDPDGNLIELLGPKL